MLITFGKKYFGKDTVELPSHHLLWILESYEECDLHLRTACQKELGHRLSLNFDSDTEKKLYETHNKLARFQKRIDHLEALLAMSTTLGANRFILEGYDLNPELLRQDLNIINQLNN